jgi:tRNA (cmo5U34)-methyltransferase
MSRTSPLATVRNRRSDERRRVGCAHVRTRGTSAEHVSRYLRRADEYPRRLEGEGVLLDHVPRGAPRILDLGTGDGRLLALLQAQRPRMLGVGLDFSAVMLAAARERFAGDGRMELVEHDLTEPLPVLGRFDAIVSSMAIHHLEHERKRSLYAEIFDLLEPGGTFANFEHVASPSHRLHVAFYAAIEEPLEHEDPSDRLLDVETQLAWLREIGFVDVDVYWKWLETALLIGVRPDR